MDDTLTLDLFDTLPLVAVSVALQAGSADDPDGKEGLAWYLAGEYSRACCTWSVPLPT